QALLVELDEDLDDGARQALIHGEALARPVAGGSEPAKLSRNNITRVLLPRPHSLEECRAAHAAPVGVVLLLEKTLHHHLRRDPGMIGARLPQDIPAAHALEADEDILDRDVERMAHMQRARHIGRRYHDAERLSLGPATRLEIAARLPRRIEAGFHF